MSGDIARLRARYVNGELSPVAVAEAHLAKAQAANDRLNAFTALLPQRALAEARASAARYQRGAPRSPIDGVPLSVKDLMHVAGEATTAASAAADGGAQVEDSEAVARLSALGAVVFAKTNLLEYAYGIVSPDFGPAHNPYALDHSAGGSSSGSAVAVAAGIGFASLGTDSGGSVRNPATWCGVVGHKPTYGALPVGGVVPLAPTLDHVGVIARSVADTRCVFEALSGGATPTMRPPRAPARIGVLRLPGAQAAVQSRFDDVLAQMASLGHVVRDVEPIPVSTANAALMTILYAEGLEVHRERLCAHWRAYSPAIRARLMAGGAVAASDYVRARAVRDALRAAWAPALAALGVDVVALPTLPVTAPSERDLALDRGGAGLGNATLYTGLFNVLGVPAVSVPIGFDPDGLPIGLQVAGVAGDDLGVLDVAAQIEALRGAWTPPPGYLDPFTL